MRILYSGNDVMRDAIAAFSIDGMKTTGRNSKFFPSSGVEKCDEVVVVATAPHADTIVSAYRRLMPHIPVRVWWPSKGSTDKHGPTRTPTDVEACVSSNLAHAPDLGSAETQEVGRVEANSALSDEMLAIVVKALFQRARLKGYTKKSLRDALVERGIEAVSRELGVGSVEELKALIGGRG